MFGGSSLFAALIDYVIFTVITLIVGTEEATLWIPVVGARVVSSLVNFTVNRNVIFAKKKDGQLARHMLSYYMLAAVILGLNYLLILTFYQNRRQRVCRESDHGSAAVYGKFPGSKTGYIQIMKRAPQRRI